MTDRETKLAHRNILTSLLLTSSEQSTRQGFVTDLFLFLLRYTFLLNNASNTQNSCAEKNAWKVNYFFISHKCFLHLSVCLSRYGLQYIVQGQIFHRDSSLAGIHIFQ